MHTYKILRNIRIIKGLSRWHDGKESTCQCRRHSMSSIPGLERSPGTGNGNPLQFYCLENSMDRGTWWATIHKVSKNWTGLSDWAHTHTELLNKCPQGKRKNFFLNILFGNIKKCYFMKGIFLIYTIFLMFYNLYT